MVEIIDRIKRKPLTGEEEIACAVLQVPLEKVKEILGTVPDKDKYRKIQGQQTFTQEQQNLARNLLEEAICKKNWISII